MTAAAWAFASLLLTFGIREVPLRTSLAPEPANDPLQMPRDATSLEELERIVERNTARENRWRVYQDSAKRVGVNLEPDEYWLLARIGERGGQESRGELEKRLTLDEKESARLFAGLLASGMAAKVGSDVVELTPDGRAAYDRLLRKREDDLRHMLSEWDRNEHPEVRALLREMASSFARTPPVKPSR
jgi:DNA-binding MarR family transcriptional regulator